MEKKLEDLSITELKALAYDQGTILIELQNRANSANQIIQQINALIAEKTSQEGEKKLKAVSDSKNK
jgi:hypothetical protein